MNEMDITNKLIEESEKDDQCYLQKYCESLYYSINHKKCSSTIYTLTSTYSLSSMYVIFAQFTIFKYLSLTMIFKPTNFYCTSFTLANNMSTNWILKTSQVTANCNDKINHRSCLYENSAKWIQTNMVNVSLSNNRFHRVGDLHVFNLLV